MSEATSDPIWRWLEESYMQVSERREVT